MNVHSAQKRGPCAPRIASRGIPGVRVHRFRYSDARLPVAVLNGHRPERQILHSRQRSRVGLHLLRIPGLVLVSIVRRRSQWRTDRRYWLRGLLFWLLALLANQRAAVAHVQAPRSQEQHKPRPSRMYFSVRMTCTYGTTIVSPAFSKISSSGLLPLITSL